MDNLVSLLQLKSGVQGHVYFTVHAMKALSLLTASIWHTVLCGTFLVPLAAPGCVSFVLQGDGPGVRPAASSIRGNIP